MPCGGHLGGHGRERGRGTVCVPCSVLPHLFVFRMPQEHRIPFKTVSDRKQKADSKQ